MPAGGIRRLIFKSDPGFNRNWLLSLDVPKQGKTDAIGNCGIELPHNEYIVARGEGMD